MQAFTNNESFLHPSESKTFLVHEKKMLLFEIFDKKCQTDEMSSNNIISGELLA